MKYELKAIAAAIFAIGLIASFAYASDPASSTAKHAFSKKSKKPAPPTVEEQIQALRQALDNQAAQIEELKTGMAAKDEQVKKAEQEAADAKAAAVRAEAAAAAQNQAVAENAAAVNTLQTAVTGIKGEQQSLTVAVANVHTSIQPPPNSSEPGAPAVIATALSKTENEALVPVRVFPVGGVNGSEIHPAFVAEGVGFIPYGFIKATGVEDSSSPDGDDFPLPGFIAANTGPNGDPEFHIKARSTRFGTNFYWFDRNKKWTLTGKVEGDFEGNFNRSDNRNLSSIRSSNPSLRVA